MHQLISQVVEPIEQDRQEPDRVVLAQGMIDCGPAPFELVLPVLATRRTVLMLPKGEVGVATV